MFLLDPFFVRGAVMGFLIALPIGPMGILCIRRSLHHGARMGWMTGLGIACGDVAYGLVAAYGLTAISSFLLDHRFWIGLVGCLFLMYMGIQSFFSHFGKTTSKVSSASGYAQAFSSAFLLTLSNPATILAFIAIYATIGAQHVPNYLSAGLFVLGIFGGSMFWWLILGGVSGHLRKKISPHFFHQINHGAGILLILFALVMLWKLLS